MTCSGENDPPDVRIDVMKIEENGPVHGIVRLTGAYRYRWVGSTIKGISTPGLCPFSLRLHFYAGTGLIGMEHFFVYDGDPDMDFVRQIGIGFDIGFRIDGMTVGTDAESLSYTCASGAMGIHQASADHFEIWKTGKDSFPETIGCGRRAAGWVHVSGEKGGVVFGIRRFWQQFHKSLHVDADAGRIDAFLWPPEAPTLDFRRYAREWGVGEDGAYENDPMPENYRLAAKGTGKSHELLFCLHEGSMTPEDAGQLFAIFDQRPLLLAPPAYYAETGALGHYSAKTDTGFDDLEAIVQRPMDYLRAAQKGSHWYGFIDYGDVQTCYTTFHRHDRWENDFGRWGWGNGDQVGRLNYALMLQFLSTGERALFLFAEANMRHVHDVDATHTSEYPFKMGTEFHLAGSVHRHNAQHYACPYVGSRGAHLMGARIHYFLTGSGRSKDILDEVLALAERLPQGAANDGHGTSAISFLCAWERTGNKAYCEKALRVLESYGLEKIRGGWMAMLTAAFGVFDAMVEYTDLSEDRRFVPLIVAFAEMCMGPDIEENWTYPGGYFRIYAEALRFCEEADRTERLLQGIHRARTRLGEQMASSSSILRETLWPAPPGESGGAFSNFSIDANTLRDLPFLMYALEHTRKDETR
ncbi:MAG: hypothetical protein FJY97_11480 [candidate division Zixibacteria bacterium]|nr:hypothetical protein [candidate division Zixibacteria bacterium]